MPDLNAQPGAEPLPGTDDIRAVVEAAYEQHSRPETETEPQAEPAEKAAPTAAERARDEQGRFANKQPQAGAEPSDPAKKSGAVQEQGKIDPPSTAVEPPKAWTAEEKANWSKLDPTVQRAIARRETEMDNGGKQWSQEKRVFQETLAPVAAVAQAYNTTPQEAIGRLVQMEQWLQRDPRAAIEAIARGYGVDLNSIPKAPATGQQQRPAQAVQQPADPRLNHALRELDGIKQALGQSRANAVKNHIDVFAKDKPHFEAVRVEMGQLMKAAASSGQPITLEQAYDRATWSNPEIRSQLLAAQASPQGNAQRQATQEATAKSRNAALSLRGSPAGGPAASPQREYATVEEATRAAWNQHMGSA